MTEQRRRSTATGGDDALNYAAVGATHGEEMLSYPPKGFSPFQGTRRIGSGDERYETAKRALLTWGVQRNSGVPVTDIARDESPAYTGIEFDEEGRPLGPADAPEELFAADGTPYVAPGTTAVLTLPIGPFRRRAPVKVVYLIDEPNRVGFAFGSRHGHPLRMEQLQFVSREEDGSVWLTIRSLAAPLRATRGPAIALVRRIQKRLAARFLTALHPTRQSGA